MMRASTFGAIRKGTIFVFNPASRYEFMKVGAATYEDPEGRRYKLARAASTPVYVEKQVRPYR